MLFIIKMWYFNFYHFYSICPLKKNTKTQIFLFFPFLEITFFYNLLQKQRYLSVELYVSFKMK